jgi:hypothetical protein
MVYRLSSIVDLRQHFFHARLQQLIKARAWVGMPVLCGCRIRARSRFRGSKHHRRGGRYQAVGDDDGGASFK